MEDKPIFDQLKFSEQICCLGKHLFHKNLPPHLQPQLKASLDLLMHVSGCKNKPCHYPNCSQGKELCNHIYITCENKRWWREKEERIEKRRREKEEGRRVKNEERLKKLRANEARLKRFYDFQMYESIRAAATAVVRLHAKGEESKMNNVKKMLGSLLSVIRYCLSRNHHGPTKRKPKEEQIKGKEEKRVKD